MADFEYMAVTNWISRVEGFTSLGQMVSENCRIHPRRKALILGRRSVSYGELNKKANRYAHALGGTLKIRPGDRVAILLNNSEDYVYAGLGALKAGATIIPLNTFLTAPELEYILTDAGAKALISSDDFAPVVREISEKIPTLERLVTVGREDLGGVTWLSEELLRKAPTADPGVRSGPDDIAVIIYTSGTTGNPKGAMLSHGNLLSNIISSGLSIKISGKDRFLLVLPMFHSFTFTVCILMPLAAGAGIVVIRRMKSISHIVEALVMRRVTVFIGIPHLYEVMSRRKPPFWLRPFITLRLCISGSAPLSGETLKNFKKNWRVPLLEGYGLSETSPVVSFNPLEGVQKPGSVGTPIPGVSVRILSGDGTPLPPGEVGEIAVKGPNVMQGYLNNPRETKETIRDGWLLTGDIGTIDGDGYIYILDRKKDMILFHGMNVYPREIEEILYTHPSVAEAAVVGRKDSRRGEVPVAFVSFKDGDRVEPQELVRFCRKSLASYKVPHRIVVLPKLPRTSTGKILKRTLNLGYPSLQRGTDNLD